MEEKKDSDITLRGDGLLLRPWKAEDASWYVEARDEEVFKWTTERRDLTVVDAEKSIRQANHNTEALGFAITDAGTGEKLGSICLVFNEESRESAEVMYWLAPWGRGRGVATSAVRMLCQWAFRSLGLRRVTLKTLAGNARSQSVAERVGFRRQELGDKDAANPINLWFELSRGG